MKYRHQLGWEIKRLLHYEPANLVLKMLILRQTAPRIKIRFFIIDCLFQIWL